MKLIEKLAMEYAHVESLPSKNYEERLELNAYEAGFRKSRELMLNWIVNGGPLLANYRVDEMEKTIRELGESEVE